MYIWNHNVGNNLLNIDHVYFVIACRLFVFTFTDLLFHFRAFPLETLGAFHVKSIKNLRLSSIMMKFGVLVYDHESMR